MKALIVCPLYPPNRSGSAIHMAHIAQGLADDGMSVTVWTTDARDTHYFVDRSMRRIQTSQEIINGVKVRRFPLSSWSMKHRRFFESLRMGHPPWTVWTFRDPATHTWMFCCGLAEIERFDLVIAGVLPHTPFIVTGLAVARKWRCPLVVLGLIHTGEPGRVEYRQEFLGKGIARLINSADMIICNTSVEARVLARRGLEEEKLISIGPGVDPTSCLGGDGAHFRRKHGIDGPIVLQLGTQTHEKGSHHTAEAICYLRNRGLPVTGVFLGFVRDDFDTGYLSQKNAHELAGLITLGEVDDATKRDALAAAQMVCMPSIADSFGISFLEGWLMGLPAIGAFAGGIPKAIDDGSDGFLIPFGDWHMLAEYVEVLIKNPNLARELGETGRRKVWRLYTWEKVFDRFRQHVYPLLPQRPVM